MLTTCGIKALNFQYVLGSSHDLLEQSQALDSTGVEEDKKGMDFEKVTAAETMYFCECGQ